MEHSKSNQSDISKYNCELCLNTSHSSFELKKHVSFGHLEDIFNCELCSQKFWKKGDLDNQKTIMHRHSFGLKCLIRNSTFKNKFSLEKHQEELTMEGSPKHLCEICFATFHANTQLKAHTNHLFM